MLRTYGTLTLEMNISTYVTSRWDEYGLKFGMTHVLKILLRLLFHQFYSLHSCLPAQLDKIHAWRKVLKMEFQRLRTLHPVLIGCVGL